MRIAVLEWICGGGLLEVEPARISAGLIAEGASMLIALSRGFRDCGMEVILPIDPRLLTLSQHEQLDGCARLVEVHTEQLAGWQRMALESDLALVIAPEFDLVLQRSVESLLAAGANLINCSPRFIETCSNKLQLASLLEHSAISHPPTQRLIDVDTQWIDRNLKFAQRDSFDPKWVLKPIDGAGCEGLKILGTSDLQAMIANHPFSHRQTATITERPSLDWEGIIVQPWIAGEALSCSAIVDKLGIPHWLPVTRQNFERCSVGACQEQTYVGCTLPEVERRWPIPHALLDALINAVVENVNGDQALGWIGVDLVYLPNDPSWTIIEINPRCTTSYVALSKAYSGSLAAEIIKAVQGSLSSITGEWGSLEYRLPS
jgi:predicted ATP-grasp superfamily ATP-dependent carboligase